MNILHLKYAVEVEKTSSITKAAENLFMGQPNLSRSIKDLEETLGIKIFKRTSKGIVPTPQGEEFLSYAKSILAQIEEMEALYKPDTKNKISFSISVPRASYITYAFTKFVGGLDPSKEIEINYKETNAVRAIRNIQQNNYNLGIIRYPAEYQHHFENMLESKDMKGETIADFKMDLLASVESPIFRKKNFEKKDLDELIEICHGDPFIPTLSAADTRKAEFSGTGKKHIYVYERGSQLDLLREVPTTYMWVSGVPRCILDSHKLAIRKMNGMDEKYYRDVLICKRNYRLSGVDKLFIDCLKKAVDEIVIHGNKAKK
jgi:DNA-binding transcriptional LysR family regulator